MPQSILIIFGLCLIIAGLILLIKSVHIKTDKTK